MGELSKTKLADLEEDFRSYKNIPKKIAEALVAKEWKPEDANSWIKGSQTHTEKALTDMIKREDNKSYLYYSKLYADITSAYESLNTELKDIVDIYFWGDSNYMSWVDIGKMTYCSTAGIYKKRYKILEALAYERGILTKVE
ncbi:transcriptional regulator [Enterococcus sp. ALS3]|uniref:Transcriptional regulator n=1 Tax=Enterococcus alishanensis TaxID=1303817 RepID=A0ABS6TDR1_9ENTE|nr:transcriptional regulator [Enterococcus alishanensis]MBV7391067.1 transcriptional regulator [Enterococcus alishanensis]